MEQQTHPTKPATDIATPPKPASSDAPTAPVEQPVAVTPAPDSADAPATPAPLPDLTDDTPAASTPAPAKKPKKAAPGPQTPVALITVTILVMFALCGVAVMIYLTSNS